MTPELLDLIKREEGLRLVSYVCPAGYPTIGYGHRIPSMHHPAITEADADALLAFDVGIAERLALKLAPNLSVYPRRLAALTDLVFNVGRDALDGVDPERIEDDSGVVQNLRAEDWTAAAAYFLKWCHARVWDPVLKKKVLKVLPGLLRRRQVGAKWIEEGP